MVDIATAIHSKMQKLSLFIQKAHLCAFFILIGCSPCTDWQYERIDSCDPCYRSVRIFYEPDNVFSKPGIEIIYSTQSEFHIFLNLYGCPLPNSSICNGLVKVLLIINGEEISFMATAFQGNQRIIIPEQYIQQIIQALLNNEDICIRIGSYCLNVPCEGFDTYYSKLVKLF